MCHVSRLCWVYWVAAAALTTDWQWQLSSRAELETRQTNTIDQQLPGQVGHLKCRAAMIAISTADLQMFQSPVWLNFELTNSMTSTHTTLSTQTTIPFMSTKHSTHTTPQSLHEEIQLVSFLRGLEVVFSLDAIQQSHSANSAAQPALQTTVLTVQTLRQTLHTQSTQTTLLVQLGWTSHSTIYRDCTL